MMTNKFLKVLTLAAGLTAGASALGAGGDIYEIRPCTQEGTARASYATIADPLTSGESVYFKMRLIQRTKGDASTVWKLDHVGAGSQIVDDALYPLQIGIYVSGQLRYATLVDASSNVSSGFTDLVFEYKTRAGDFALPIVLAAQTIDGPAPASDSDESLSYLLNRLDKWNIVNDAGQTCNLWFWSPTFPVTPPDGSRMQDYSLAQSGLYVKTIDFDNEWEVPKGEPGQLWRSVHENSTITVGATPKLTAIAAPEDAVVLHVWSTDDSSVRIKGGHIENIVVGYNADNSPIVQPTVVGDISIAGGQLTADFQIEGVAQGTSCALVLSPWIGYNYSNGTGARIIDYVTVPVKCIEPMPPTVVVECDRKVAYANGDYMTYGALLTVYLSQAYDAGDLEVTVTPSFADGAGAAWGDYIRFSTTQDEVTALPEATLPKVTIPAGSTAKQQIYAFFLRGDTHTSGSSRMVFTPSIDDPVAQTVIRDFTAAGMEVRAEAPVITTPTEGATIDGICGDDIEFTLAVSDTYADSSDDTTGYKIFIKYRASDAFKQLDGTYYVGEGNVLYMLDEAGVPGSNKTTQLPIINYPASGEGMASQVYVVSPVSGKKSEVRNFTANIKEARTSEVVTVNGDDVFYEGDQASFKITISEKNDTGNTIYAFLKASDNATAGMFSGTPLFVVCGDTDYTRTKGLPINNYQNATSASKIKFLDGLSEDAGGLSITFEVVLCTSQNYDPAKRIAGYDSNYLNLTVFNLEPTITRIEMNGFESEGNGYVFPNKVPKNMDQSFKAVVADKGKYDVSNTAEPFQCKWTATLAGVGAIKTETIEGDPETHPFVYNFPRAGEWTLKLQVKDKDMEDWSEQTYSIGVSVLDNPQVLVTVPEAIAENDHSGKVQVQLSYWDSLFTGKLRVKVTVSEYSAGRTNPGELKLDSGFASVDPTEVGVYYVEIGDALPTDLLIENMDGTEVSSLYGFVINAEVVSTDVLPTSGTAANVYYINDHKRMLVNNVEPVCIVNPQENTNRWEVAGGVAQSHPIRWQVKSDVDGDFTGIPTFPGIKVSFLGCQNATEQYVTESASGVFYPDFGDSQGDQDVTLIIEDKDGGYLSWTWQFTVTPSKFLTTIATGPFGGMTTSPLSKKYSLLGEKKLGKGHTWVENATFSSAKNFMLRWNCSKDVTKQIYAFGYKVANPVDNGTLDGRDQAIDATGSAHVGVTPMQFYRYPEADAANEADVKDSFFYCWILHSSSSDGATTESILGNTILPERPGVIGSGTVTLPTEQTPDGNYFETQVEAVFAKEWLKTDNLGDINQDGVPDVFAMADWNGGNLISLVAGDGGADGQAASIVDNDLISLAGSNPDEDYLPGVFSGVGTAFAGSNGNSYAPIGVPFTTRMEIRGFADGLNAIDLTRSDVDFSEDEQKAYTAATGKAYDPATVDLNEWSPEPRSAKISRMDPTLADTDGDGFPDGWEYYFWYMAHVWAPAGADAAKPRGGQTFTFERFNVGNILVGDEIPATEVEARFNPCDPLEASVLKNNPDFDNDGLSDLEELVLGTNPCHWDTDGDHMCDGWEVMMNLDPLNGSKDGNEDGDFMAMHSMLSDLIYTDENDVTWSVQGLVPGRDYDLETLVTVRDVSDVTAFSFEDSGVRYGLVSDLPGADMITAETTYGCGLARVTGRKTFTRFAPIPEGTPLKEGAFMADQSAPLILIHNQVLDAFDFDPRTAWNRTGSGYVSDRWDPSVNRDLSPLDVTGVAVNTRPYNNYDEYLVMLYRMSFALVYDENDGGNTDDVWRLLRSKTTNPSVVVDAPVADTTDETTEDTTDDTAAETDRTSADISQAVADALQASGSMKTPMKGHGADTDGDGVPDGWELYMYRNPNAGPTMLEDGLGTPGQRDFDGDNLSYADEFAGTDSCNVYRDCPSIYRNHPGLKKGWYNKFFPTNPGMTVELGEWILPGDRRGADTDGDGVLDADEGGEWPVDFYNDGKVYPAEIIGNQSAIYGTPEDDGSCCIRGGGMNPCTIDTDQDGLPDGWEMQHAGVAVTMVGPATIGADKTPTGENEVGLSTFLADGYLVQLANASSGTTTNDTDTATTAGQIVYIAGGMDPTWKGDACSDATSEGLSYDERVGTVRDVDFDHDGLQNYQEYLVQSLRHFRYDDVTTPLMGRLLTGTGPGAYTQKFYGYAPFNSGDVVKFAEDLTAIWGANGAAAMADVLAREDVNTAAQQPWTVEGWRALGYFAPPAKSWDRALTSMNFRAPLYMLPVIGQMATLNHCAGYVSTDPRMADTDGDGMDDFYELFHGLNPILGADPSNPVNETAWMNGKKGDIISAVYWMVNYPVVDTRPTFNAYYNAWIYPTFDVGAGMGGGRPCAQDAITAPQAFDPILYPWAMGGPLADADGDGMRNLEESLKANVTSPMPRHTDPTPAWFTDHTTWASYTGQYYVYPDSLKNTGFSWAPAAESKFQTAAVAGGTGDYAFSFEEGEGYDTDNDWVPDSREVVTTAMASTDPLRFDDPSRRQALWLNGVDAFAMSVEGQVRPTLACDLLKQFTVECWVRPELTGADQTVVERSCCYTGDSINTDAVAIRANFRIGVKADGRVYGMFDNSDSIESGLNQPISCQVVNGPELPLNEWTHVAMTYDGQELALYINSYKIRSEKTQLIPANGVTVLRQNPGNTESFQDFDYDYLPCSLFIGARPQKKAAVTMVNQTLQKPYLPDQQASVVWPEFSDFREFFKGYVDEVRIWDGARTQAQISDSYLKRFTLEEVKANRDAVYAAWKPTLTAQPSVDDIPNGTRNENDGKDMLPAELVNHYSFQTLPGAVKAADVAKTPVGFTSKVLGSAASDYGSNDDIVTDGLYVDADMSLKGGAMGAVAGGLTIGWWENCTIHSTVYNDYHVVPWIENTVAHLPMMDGSCVDSFLYNESVAASYVPAPTNGVKKYIFPNSAIPYAKVSYGTERYMRLFTFERLWDAYQDLTYLDLYNRYRFHIRSKFLGTSDLVPMGGAFAKACDMMWDGCAGDAWEYTGTDDDGDGLPNWWEEYARNNYCEGLDPSAPLSWDTVITYRGMKMTAAQAYLIDIAMGMQPNGEIDPAYASTADSDHNGLPDWWERLFGVEGADAFADSDNDGLSNYVEYLLSFVFDVGQIFDPARAYSVNDYDIDYFFPIGSLYAGEIFTDNDMIEDAWEGKYGTAYANRFVWDADSDRDEDGWSLFSECRYNTFVSTIMADKISHMLGDAEKKDFPIPTLKLTLRYNLSQVLSKGDAGSADGNASNTDESQVANKLPPLVIKTYTHKGTQEDNVVADATFKVQPGEAVKGYCNLGMYGERIVRGSLTPGYVKPGSINMEMMQFAQDDSYTWLLDDMLKMGNYKEYMYDLTMYGHSRVVLQSGEFEWSEFNDVNALTVTQNGDSSKGYICLSGERVGTIDTQTGAFELDLAPFGRYGLEGTNAVYSLKQAAFRLVYESQVPTLESKKLELFLGDTPDGYVREGKNRVVAFYDINGDDEYTPGEPLGFAEDVDVSWKQGAAEIELTDTTPVITRMKLEAIGEGGGDGEGAGSVASDRYALYGDEDGDYRALMAGSLSGGDYQRIRIVRTLVNGYSIDTLKIPNAVIVDKWIHLKQRPYIFEGDVLSDTELDLDWSLFQSQVMNSAGVLGNQLDVTNVVYRIVLGNGTTATTATNNLFAVATVRHFDPNAQRVIPTLVSPGVGGDSIVYGARPTFKWTMNGYNSYTAFQLQIQKGGSVVWDSGVRLAPARDSNGNYTFVPDVYLGDLLEAGQKYTWRVAMYNAKFRDPVWSANTQTFMMSSGSAGYGSVDVCVKYFGPALDTGTIRVEAYTTPDFTGDPVARTYVADTTDVSTFGLLHKANAKLIGLTEGTYYIRAYIDTNSRGKNYAKDEWESWGYACPRERSAQMFNPSSVVVSSDAVAGQVVLVYIEDVDQNGNNIPDAWEYANGGMLNQGANNVTDALTGGVAVNSALATLIEREDAKVPGGLAGQVMATLSNAAVQSMIFQVSVPEGGDLAAMLTEATEVVEGSVAITDATFDQVAKKVTLTIEAEVENEYAGTLASALYTFNSETADVTCCVWRKATLAEAGWTKVAEKVVTVGRDAATVEVDLSDLDLTESGFFKVTLEK